MKLLIPSLLIFSWLVFFRLTRGLFPKAKLSFTKNSYSQLGSHKTYGKSFNRLLGFVAVSEGMFLFQFIRAANADLRTSAFLFLITTVCAFIVSFVTEKGNPIMHRIIAVAGFLCAFTGWFILSRILFGTLLYQLALGIISAFVLTKINYRTYVLPAVYENVIFRGAFLTNIILIGIVYL